MLQKAGDGCRGSRGVATARTSDMFKFSTQLLSAGVRQAQCFREGVRPAALAVPFRSLLSSELSPDCGPGDYFPGCWEDGEPRKSRGQRPPSPTGQYL